MIRSLALIQFIESRYPYALSTCSDDCAKMFPPASWLFHPLVGMKTLADSLPTLRE